MRTKRSVTGSSKRPSTQFLEGRLDSSKKPYGKGARSCPWFRDVWLGSEAAKGRRRELQVSWGHNRWPVACHHDTEHMAL
jgi:hypothetical protein